MKCKAHKTYKGIKRPSAKCIDCLNIYIDSLERHILILEQHRTAQDIFAKKLWEENNKLNNLLKNKKRQ